MLRLFKRRKSVPLSKEHYHSIIKAEILNRTVLLLVDSGSDRSYIDKSFFDSLEYKGTIKEADYIIGATGDMEVEGQIDTEVTIGGNSYKVPMVIFPLEGQFMTFGKTPAERPVGILGAKFLYAYRMILDYNKMRLYL